MSDTVSLNLHQALILDKNILYTYAELCVRRFAVGYADNYYNLSLKEENKLWDFIDVVAAHLDKEHADEQKKKGTARKESKEKNIFKRVLNKIK